MLRDCLATNLRLVICGTAAGATSAVKGQYYAGSGNKFWKTLYDIGLTPRLLDPSEYKELLSYGIGLTDIVKGQAGMDEEIDFRRLGREELSHKILRYRPRVLCFNGKRAARAFLGRKMVEFGTQRDKVGSTRLFVAPSTSGAANRYWDLSLWRQLAHLVQHSVVGADCHARRRGMVDGG